jgi:hypothetical protein
LTALDIGKLPVIRFHVIFLILFLGMTYLVYSEWNSLFRGFWISAVFQAFVFECKFISFRIWRSKSFLLQGGIILISFFGNFAILIIQSPKGGSSFILGFFLAYFTFLTIFVLSAIVSKKVVRSTL